MSKPTAAEVADYIADELDGTYVEGLGRYASATAVGGILSVKLIDPDTQEVTSYNAFMTEVAG